MRDRARWRNWGRNQQCTPAAVEEPTSELEVIEAVERAKRAGQTVKVVGAGHSFTGIACTDGRMLRLGGLNRVVAIDREAATVTVEGGIPLWQLNEALETRHLALPNLGDIDRQSISGAIATATHGGGKPFGGLATFVVGLELVTGDGDLLRCSLAEEPEVFACARVGLGALGVVTKVTLQCQPSFRLHSIEKPRPLDALVDDLDDIIDRNEHIDCYWFPHTDVATVKVANRTGEPIRTKSSWKAWRDDILLANFAFGAAAKLGQRRPDMIPKLMNLVAGGIGKTEVVDVSHRVLCSRRLVRFVEMEYAIPRPELGKTLLRVRDLIEGEGLTVNFPIELRVAAPDDIPLSTAQGRETGYLAVHLSAGMPFDSYFRGVEAIMDDIGGRPHWGKMHYQTAETLAPRYPEWTRFQSVRARTDPEERFRNPYLDRVLGSVTSP
ncbi:MAG TPA: D-arabinono-1,4-lactone oxidase [Acidimicrobiia bacterium]|nr:D-arabinono-1,4-lactone oxidase [Acidimicrobiia bacterium]